MTMFNISLQHIYYTLSDGKPIFQDISADFVQLKTGIVGSNGTGKTTLLKLISGEIQPADGLISKAGTVSALPQNHLRFNELTVSTVLGFEEKLSAFRKICSGTGTAEDFEVLDDDWEIEDRFKDLLNRSGLGYLTADRRMHTLSGGEKTRILFLAEIQKNPDFLLLDEPTNHLDSESKQALYSLIAQWKKGLIVVSHDRELLRLMNQIADLSPNGLKFYGGNFDFYSNQKSSEENAAESEFLSLTKELKKEREHIRAEMEKLNKQSTRSRKRAMNTGITKMVRGIMQRSAENTAGRKTDIYDERLNNLTRKVTESKSKLPENHHITIDLQESIIPSRKIVLSVQRVNFGFEDHHFLWKEPLSFEIVGPERISVSGKNGSGKSLLCRLLTNQMSPSTGKIVKGVNNVSVLDQHVSFLNDERSILENMSLFANDKLPEHELRIRLGRFLFYKDSVFKTCGILSGGERLRTGLACLLATENAPELLILDEPNNNLDFNSMKELTSALSSYKGALIVISHDQDFLNSLNLEREIRLEPV